MFTKRIFSVPLSLLFTSLHIACCVIPLFSAAAGTFLQLDFFIKYKTAFTAMQLFLLTGVGIRLLVHHFSSPRFHSKLESFSWHVSMLIIVSGLGIGYYEPFQSENQRIAQRQFEFFKAHRHIEFSVEGDYDVQELKREIARIKGVKTSKVSTESAVVAITFQHKKISKSQIMSQLRRKGYQLVIAE